MSRIEKAPRNHFLILRDSAALSLSFVTDIFICSSPAYSQQNLGWPLPPAHKKEPWY